MINKFLNYTAILFAFVFPLSLAGANVILGLMLLLWIIERNFKHKFELLKKDKVFLSFIGIIVFITLSTLLSNSYNQGFLINSGLKNEFYFIGKHLIWGVLFYLVFISSIKKEYLNKIVSAFLIAMFINEIISYSVFFHLIDIKYFKSIGLLYRGIEYYDPSPMNHSFYSLYLAITILILLDRFLKHKDNIFLKIGILFFLISATTNLFVNGGRTGQLAVILGLFIYFILYFRKNYKYLISGFLIIFIVVGVAYKFSPIFKQRMDKSKTAIEKVINKKYYCTSWGQRIGMNIVGFSYLFDNHRNFIFGGFAGEAKKNYLEYGKKNYKKIFHCFKHQSHLHNQFLQLWIDGGIFTFILTLYLFYNLFRIKTDIFALQFSLNFVIIFSFIADIMLYRAQTAFLLFFIFSFIKLHEKEQI